MSNGLRSSEGSFKIERTHQRCEPKEVEVHGHRPTTNATATPATAVNRTTRAVHVIQRGGTEPPTRGVPQHAEIATPAARRGRSPKVSWPGSSCISYSLS